jgi:hypothetical protein
VGLRADFPSGPGVAERELEVGFGKRDPGAFRPFDQADSFSLEVIGKTRICKLTLVKESIKIKVVQV